MRVGETLTADTSGISDSNGLTNVSYAYQWIRDDGNSEAVIPGATGQTYTLTDDDLNQTVKVTVSFTDDDGYTEMLTSAATGMVDPPANEAPTGLPTVTGTVRVGETLTADTSGISDSNGLTNVSYAYQWIRDDGNSEAVIPGATGETYTLTDDDLDTRPSRCTVSFTDDDGYTETLTSAATGMVDPPANEAPTGLPTVTGTARVGETLTADTSGINDSNGLNNVSYAYQWIRDDGNSEAVIPGATGQTYTLTDDDLDKAIKVQVSFTDDDGYPESLTSAATGMVDPPANEAPTGLPTVTGTARVGETLTADTSGIGDSNGLTNVSYGYQWIRDDGNSEAVIPGATGQTYTLTDDDLDKAIKVQVSFTDDDGYTESLTSAATDIPPATLQQTTTSISEPNDQDFSADTTTGGVVNVGDSVGARIKFCRRPGLVCRRA